MERLNQLSESSNHEASHVPQATEELPQEMFNVEDDERERYAIAMLIIQSGACKFSYHGDFSCDSSALDKQSKILAQLHCLKKLLGEHV